MQHVIPYYLRFHYEPNFKLVYYLILSKYYFAGRKIYVLQKYYSSVFPNLVR